MKTIVIYHSVSGFTEKYARWIAEELGADLFTVRAVKPEMLDAYDVIIFGGNLHAVGINGVGIIRKNLDRQAGRLDGKKVIVFATGASPNRKEIPREIISKNFTPAEQERIRFFYLRGGFDYGKLDLPNKVLMTLLKWKLRAKKVRTADDEGMLNAYGHPVDFTRRENIAALVACARGES